MRISDWSSDVCSSDLRSRSPRFSVIAINAMILHGELIPAHELGSISHMPRSEEHTSELQSLMRISYAVFGLKKKQLQSLMRIYYYVFSLNNRVRAGEQH